MPRESEFTIVRVIARLNIGGPAMQAILMTDYFRQRGYRALLLTGGVPSTEGSMEYLAHDRGVVPLKIHSMSRKISWWKDLITLWQLIKIFRHEKPTVVHTHTAKAGSVGRLAAILSRVPIRVHTFHGHVFYGYFSPLATRLFQTIERFLAAHSDCIVAISESQKRDLAEVYKIASPDKIAVIPLGFDLNRFLALASRNNEFRKSLACDEATFLVGWVGRLTAIKDPGLFLQCARELVSPSENIRFVLIGDGERRNQCENEILSKGLQNVAFLTGWQKDLELLYADLDLVVLTSVNEGTPVSLLEAMASAKAFVATDVGGVRDLMVGPGRWQDGYEIFRNGILAPRDGKVIVGAVSFLQTHPELRRAMGDAGREFVKTRFSSERLADDLESLYLSLAQVKRRVPKRTTLHPEGKLPIPSSTQK